VPLVRIGPAPTKPEELNVDWNTAGMLVCHDAGANLMASAPPGGTVADSIAADAAVHTPECHPQPQAIKRQGAYISSSDVQIAHLVFV
jgi:hypothetical protein